MKIRTISALVTLAIVIPFIYYGGIPYSLAIGIISLLAFKELLDLKKAHKVLPFMPCLIAVIGILLLTYTNFNGDSIIYGATYKRLIFCFLSLLIPTIFYTKEKYTTKDAFYLIGVVCFLGIACNSFILVRDMGISIFIYLFLIPVVTDTFAYIIGTLIGKHKMCPKISPKKSWEGFAAGLGFGTFIPSLAYYLMVGNINLGIILATAILSVMGQLGDLMFSKIKRENDIKDFSNLIPGHGGILDRLDSAIIIFVSFIFLSSVLF